MKPALSPKMNRLYEMVKAHPDQTAADYQSLTDAEDEQKGIHGRTFACPAGLTKLYQDKYLIRYLPDGERAFRYKARNKGGKTVLEPGEQIVETNPPVPKPKGYKKPKPNTSASFEVLYNVVLASGRKLDGLTIEEAKELLEGLARVVKV